MVDANKYDPRILSLPREDMLPYTGERVLVRDTVARKLAAVNARLKEQGYGLKVLYGYRHPELQKAYFENCMTQIKKEWDDEGEIYTQDELK